MARRFALGIGLTAWCVAAGGAGALRAQDAAPAPPATSRSVWDGVYTEMQANRGEREFGRSCEHCHGQGLEGDSTREIPSLASESFMRKWDGKNVKELFEMLSRSMPADNRGRLTARTYVDLIAYLLRANDVPTGSTPLPDAPSALELIRVQATAPTRP